MVFITADFLESRYRALCFLDASALAIAVPAGVAAAMDVRAGRRLVLVTGMMTGCLGGLLRDVVCNGVPLVLKQGELYATVAFAGAAARWRRRRPGCPAPHRWRFAQPKRRDSVCL